MEAVKTKRFRSRSKECAVALELGWKMVGNDLGSCPRGPTGGVDWEADASTVRFIEGGGYDPEYRLTDDSIYEVVATGRRFGVQHGNPRWQPRIYWLPEAA